MKTAILAIAAALGAASVPAAAAQDAPPVVVNANQTVLDLAVTGTVTRVPDIATVSAGVQTRAATASEALRQNSATMDKVIAALRRLGIEERDIRTERVNLNPDYDYSDRSEPVLRGYNASNSVSVRFRDIEMTGRILDILVNEGANQINGPSFSIDDEASALDEARTDALRKGRQRADLYAAALGKRVVRLAAVSEGGGMRSGPIVVTGARMESAAADVPIVPGEQEVGVSLNLRYVLE